MLTATGYEKVPRKSMPRLIAIRNYWMPRSEKELPNIAGRAVGWGEPFCFRCGWLSPIPSPPWKRDLWSYASGWLERAHLKSHFDGGDEAAANLMPLCVLCHYTAPEFEDRDEAIEWVLAAHGRRIQPVWWQLATDTCWGGDRFEPYPGFKDFMAMRQRTEEYWNGLPQVGDVDLKKELPQMLARLEGTTYA